MAGLGGHLYFIAVGFRGRQRYRRDEEQEASGRVERAKMNADRWFQVIKTIEAALREEFDRSGDDGVDVTNMALCVFDNLVRIDAMDYLEDDRIWRLPVSGQIK